MKKVLYTAVAFLFFIAALFFSWFFISSFFTAQTEPADMQQIKICFTEKEEWDGRYPSVMLYTKDKGYEISAAWYDEFDLYAFNENFSTGKEYTLTVNRRELNDGSDYIYIYGIADEKIEYLNSKDAIKADRINSVMGLIVGLMLLCGVIVLVALILYNKKSVWTFLKEFYSARG